MSKYDPPPLPPDEVVIGAEDDSFYMHVGMLWYQPPTEDDYREDADDDEDEDEEEEDGEPRELVCRPDPFYVCQGLQIIANTSDERDTNHGRLIEITTKNGSTHRLVISMADFESPKRIRARLVENGLEINWKHAAVARRLLVRYLERTRGDRNIRVVTKPGWYGDCFILPDGQKFGAGKDNIEYIPPEGQYFGSRMGTHAEWQQLVARPCLSNWLMVFCLSVAFAAPFLKRLNRKSFIVHVFGLSGDGKTTTVSAAASLTGSAEEGKIIRSWNGSEQALLDLTPAFNGYMLILDELKRSNPPAVQKFVYDFCSVVGRERSTSTGRLQARRDSQLIGLSTGELTLREHLERHHIPMDLGQEVRILNIPSDAGCGMGMIHHLPHPYTDPKKFVDDIAHDASFITYGSTIPLFLEDLTANLQEQVPFVGNKSDEYCEWQTQVHTVTDKDAKRVLPHFGLIAGAGELAIRGGYLPFPEGHCMQAAAYCFSAWLRGHIEQQAVNSLVKRIEMSEPTNRISRVASRDYREGSRLVLEYVNKFGGERFQSLEPGAVRIDDQQRDGYRETRGDTTRIYFHRHPFKRLISKYRPVPVLRDLQARGELLSDADRYTKKVFVPELNKTENFYCVVLRKGNGSENENTPDQRS